MSKLMYHLDPEVNKAIVELNDRLCTWERNTSRGAAVIIIPSNPDEKIHVSFDGKPWGPDMSPLDAFAFAMKERDEND